MFSHRGLVVFPDPLLTIEAHLGFQKCPGLHAKKQTLGNSQPRSQIPAGSPQDALQSQWNLCYMEEDNIQLIYATLSKNGQLNQYLNLLLIRNALH